MSNYVLIVDDDQAVRSLVVSIIESMELQPIPASNGVDAVMAFNSYGPQNFSAAIVDLSMPQMNGKDLVRLLKSANPAIVTILCSGLPDLLLGNSSPSDHGFNAVIRKPFLPEDFKSRFLRALMDS